MSSTSTTPGEVGPGDFYDVAPLEREQLYQGEILVDVPILNMPKPQGCWTLLRTRSGRRIHDALKDGEIGGKLEVLDSNLSKEQWHADGLGDYVMAVLDKRPVLVMNQTCDVQTKDYIQVAPIFEYTKTGEALNRLKNGSILPAFWLKPHPPEIKVDSYADFEQLQAVHKSYVRRIVESQHFRLNAEQTRKLQRAITRYFGRPNSFDSRTDKAPVAGTYLCARCFYFDARVTIQEREAGTQLQPCEECHDTLWVLKGR